MFWIFGGLGVTGNMQSIFWSAKSVVTVKGAIVKL
jgi:hypothetical protein